MSPANPNNVYRQLRRCQIPTPSPELRERVLRTAHDAWHAQTQEEILWTMPLLRLAACLVLAAIPLALTQVMDSRLPEPGFQTARYPARIAPEDAELWAMAGRPELARLAAFAPSPDRNMGESLRNHMKRTRAMLENGI